jgi:hypothetical protein
LRADVAFYMQKAYNLIRGGYFLPDPDNTINNYTGYQQVNGLSQSLMGIQTAFVHRTLDVEIPYNKFDVVYGGRQVRINWLNELNVQWAQGKEYANFGQPNLNAIRNLPMWITQFRTSLRVNQFELVLSNNRQSSWQSGTALYSSAFQRTDAPDRVSKFKTWDWMTRLYLSDHFLVYLHFQNLWNNRYGGIDATGTPDDLLWNPQMGRSWKFGINYSMN